MPAGPNFDSIARLYRWLEYLTLGPVLERIRFHHIPALAGCRRALILGDGDGRFTAALLRRNPSLRAEAVDLSARMLALLSRRVKAPARLRTCRADVRDFIPETSPDLIATHFLLDCLTQPEVNALVARLMPRLSPGGLWLISDFRIPDGALHWPARLYVRALYVAFHVLTGLHVTSLPDHAAPLLAAGMQRIAIHRTLFGLLTTELWQRP